MRDKTLKLWLLAVSMTLILPGVASAAGLGRLTILSTLGHPLSAEVELLAAQKNETITAKLASPDVYQQANAQYNSALVNTRVSVEKRGNGQVYLKVTTTRPVNEPFIELLIEINSENGRTVRQYTALLDPPGYGRAAGEIPPPAVASAPETRAASSGSSASSMAATPLPDTSATTGAPPVPKPVPAGAAGAKQYGPIKPGETLGRIARSVKPEGVTLEQTLVGLYSQNPDAFIKKNMNLVRSGKILRVPEPGEMSAMPQRQAVQEVRLQVADFNAFRQRVADRVGAAPEGGSVTSGRIGTRVAESAGEGARDTVRLSRGETSGKGKGGGKAKEADRVRALEEEAMAREKALAEANARISQLEQIIKDSQRAAELKGSGAAPAPKGAEKAASPGAVAVAPPGVAAPKGADTPPPAPAQSAPPAAIVEAPKAPDTAPPVEPPRVAKAKPAPPPPPAPEGSFFDTLMSEPLYLAAAGGVVLLGGLGFMMARRRRNSGDKPGSRNDIVRVAPSLTGGGAGSAPAGGAAPARPPVLVAPTAPAEEAKPKPAAPPPAARPRSASGQGDDNDLDFNLATGRAGGAPKAPAGGKNAPTAAPAKPAPAKPAAVAGPAPRATEAAPPGVAEPRPRAPEPPPIQRAPEPVAPPPPRGDLPRVADPKFEPLMPDFALDPGGLTMPASKSEPATPVEDPHVVDFNLEPLPPINAPMNLDKVSSEPPASMDFKLDLADLDINAPAAGGGAKDDHWYDVQQKFDLAKAYEEMGDKDGAREILQEVLREGDGEQQGQAKKLLGSLS